MSMRPARSTKSPADDPVGRFWLALVKAPDADARLRRILSIGGAMKKMEKSTGAPVGDYGEADIRALIEEQIKVTIIPTGAV